MARNAAKTQQETEKGERFSTMECAPVLAPGWRIPLVRLAYGRVEGSTLYKGVSEITFGVAAMADAGMLLVPIVGRKKEFVAGTDLATLLEAAGATDVEYIDVWQTVSVSDVWQGSDRARRRVNGVVRRYYPNDGRSDAGRDVSRDIGVLMRDIERFGIQPEGMFEVESHQEVQVPKGCQLARAARRRQEERRANAKKPDTSSQSRRGRMSLLEVDGDAFRELLAEFA